MPPGAVAAVNDLDETGSRLKELLRERYLFHGLLGRGGFATVYQVTSVSLLRAEALKVLTRDATDDSDFAERLVREARLAASFSHPGILQVFDFGQVGGHFYYTMELVEGETIARRLERTAPLEVREAVGIAVAILDALEYCHERGVVHRDIKPENIILDREGHPFLADFGIAKAVTSRHTSAGLVLGTPAYISPEQYRAAPLDGRSDVYSLGLVLYEMLTGVVPFQCSDPLLTAMRRLEQNPAPPSTLRPGLDPRLEAAVLKALERDPGLRFGSAAAMRDALVPLSGDPSRATVPVQAGPTGAVRAGRTVPVRAGPSSWGRIARLAVGAGVVLLAAFGAWRVYRPAPGRPTGEELARPAASGSPAPRPAAGTSEMDAPQRPSPPGSSPPAVVRSGVAGEAGGADAPRAARPTPIRPPEIVAEAAGPAGAHRVRIPPDVVEEAAVILPQDIASECTGRSVGVSIVVDHRGELKTARVISAVSPACDRVALEAVRKYRFRAALDRSGTPVEGRFALAVRF